MIYLRGFISSISASSSNFKGIWTNSLAFSSPSDDEMSSWGWDKMNSSSFNWSGSDSIESSVNISSTSGTSKSYGNIIGSSFSSSKLIDSYSKIVDSSTKIKGTSFSSSSRNSGSYSCSFSSGSISYSTSVSNSYKSSWYCSSKL